MQFSFSRIRSKTKCRRVNDGGDVQADAGSCGRLHFQQGDDGNSCVSNQGECRVPASLSSQQQTSFVSSGAAPAPSLHHVRCDELCWTRRTLFWNGLNAICSIREGLHAELAVFRITWSQHKQVVCCTYLKATNHAAFINFAVEPRAKTVRANASWTMRMRRNKHCPELQAWTLNLQVAGTVLSFGHDAQNCSTELLTCCCNVQLGICGHEHRAQTIPCANHDVITLLQAIAVRSLGSSCDAADASLPPASIDL